MALLHYQTRRHVGRVKRIWYLSPMRAAIVQASLRIRAVSREPPLLAHTSSESGGTFRNKARSLAPLNGWACAVKLRHDGMLEDTNSLHGAHMIKSFLMHCISTIHIIMVAVSCIYCGQKCVPIGSFSLATRLVHTLIHGKWYMVRIQMVLKWVQTVSRGFLIEYALYNLSLCQYRHSKLCNTRNAHS